MKQIRKAVFPGSFDPFTIGHYDVLCSALKIFDEVVIAVGINSSKRGFFDKNERVEFIQEAIKGLEGVSVCTYEKLTVDFCKEIGAKYMIRGLRSTTDFEFENAVAQANKKIAPEISTIFIPASGEYSFVSSTVVRELLVNGGDISEFLPKGVTLKKRK